MTSTLTLYKNSKIIPERNLIVEGISTYLNTLTKTTISDFQFQRFLVEMDIKVDLTQQYQYFDDDYDFNYCSITDGSGLTQSGVVYYFITNKKQVAEKTMAFHLVMDTINTFGWNSDYIPSNRTKVIREHKDRFAYNYNATYILILSGVSIDTNTLPQDIDFNCNIVMEDGDETSISCMCHYYYSVNPPLRRLEFWNFTNEGLEWIMSHLDSMISYIGNADDDTEYMDFIDFPLLSDIFSQRQLLRVIDLKSEEIQAPVYKTQEYDVYENEGKVVNSWTLYYRNKTSADNSPIQCYLIPSEPLEVNYNNSSNTITPSDIPDGKYLFFYSGYNGAFNFNVSGTNYSIKRVVSSLGTQEVFYCVSIKNNSGTLELYYLTYLWNYASNRIVLIGPTLVSETSNTGFEYDLVADTIKGRQMNSIGSSWNISDPDRPFRPNNYNVTFSTSGTQTIVLNTVDSIDRTLQENIKIINIPYSPSQIEIDNSNIFTFEGIWQLDSVKKFLELTNFNARFMNYITSNVDDFLNEFRVGTEIDLTAGRFLLDSKLFHSDFYRPKFVYDSFTKVFPLEQINYRNTYELKANKEKFEFTFTMTRNIVSKFLFQFNYVYNNANEDYPNMLAVARNNEEVIYNSQYLNYIRTGYNYDLKTKERNEIASGVGLGLSIAGLIGSIALTASGYGSGVGVAGIIGSVGGIAGSIVGFAKSVAQAEDNIQRKLQESQRQSVSVLNADDSDLLYAYTNNKAKLCLYRTSEQMSGILDDMFYFIGYATNETKIPDLSTRYWFNFVQCDLEIESSGSNLSEEIRNNIKEKFASGVTILHNHNTNWNFDLDKENWEVSLL